MMTGGSLAASAPPAPDPDGPTLTALTTESALLVATKFLMTGLKSTSRILRLRAFRKSEFDRGNSDSALTWMKSAALGFRRSQILSCESCAVAKRFPSTFSQESFEAKHELLVILVAGLRLECCL